MNAVARKEVLNGRLSDFAVSTLLHAFSLGRTVMSLEVLSSTGEVVGSVLLKSGKVLAATAGSLSGPEALEILMRERKARFRVFSEGTPVYQHRPIGSVAELTSEGARLPTRPDNDSMSSAVTDPGASDSGVRPRIPVMAGSLSEFDVASLMRVVSSGRQHTAIEILNEASNVTGTIFLKAGKVVSARAGSVEGVAAVCEILELPPNFNFAIFRVPTEAPYEAIGSVDEILRLATDPMRATSGVVRVGSSQHPPSDGIQRSRVMEGSVADADVPSLLQVLGSSRQYTELEFFRADGTFAGEIHIKAGKMLRATADELDGVLAVRRLIGAPPDFRFRASRRMTESDLPPPVGAIGEILMRAISEHPPARSDQPLSIVSELPVPPSAPPRVAPLPAALPTIPRVSAPESSADVPTAPPRKAPELEERIMAGSLSEFEVGKLMQVLSTSRQQTKLELFNEASKLVATVRAKSGNLLSATIGDETGEQAFRTILYSPRAWTFAISRIRTSLGPADASLGSIRDVALRARAARAEARAQTEHKPSAVAAAPAPAPQVAAAPAPPPSRQWVLPLVGLIAAAGLATGAFALGRSTGPATPTEKPANTAALVPTPAKGPAPSTGTPPPSEPAAAPNPTDPSVGATAAAPVTPSPTPPSSEPAPAPKVVRAPAPNAVAAAPRGTPDPAIRNAQLTLLKAGHNPGEIDGVLGQNTAEALRAFQAAEHLPVTGTLTEATRAALAARERRKP